MDLSRMFFQEWSGLLRTVVVGVLRTARRLSAHDQAGKEDLGDEPPCGDYGR